MQNIVDISSSKGKIDGKRERPELLGSGTAGKPSRNDPPYPGDAIQRLKYLLRKEVQSGESDMKVFDESPVFAPVPPSLSPSSSSSSNESALRVKAFQNAIASRQVQQREVHRLANELVLCPTLEALYQRTDEFFQCVVESFLQHELLMQKTHKEFKNGPDKDPLCRSVQKEISALKEACGASVFRVAEIETAMTQSPDGGSPFPTNDDIQANVTKHVYDLASMADDMTMLLEERISGSFLVMNLRTFVKLSLVTGKTQLPVLILEFRRRVTGMCEAWKALERADHRVDHLNDQRAIRAVLTQVWKGITTKQTLSLWLSEHPCPQPAMAAPEAKGDGEEKPPPRELVSDNDGVLLRKLVELMIAQLTETEKMLANTLVSVVCQVGQYVPSNEQQGSCSDQVACWFALVDRCLSIDMRADLEKNAPAPQGHEEAAQKELEAQIERLRELAKKKLVKEKVAVMRANQNQQRRQHVQSSMNDFETAIESASSEETLSMMLKTILTSVGEAMAHVYELFPPTREEQEEKNDSNNSHHPQQKMLKEILDDFFITLHGHTKWWVSSMLSRLVDVTALTGDELLTHGRYVDAVRRAMATALSVSLNHLSSEAVLRIVDDSVPLVLTPMYLSDPWEESLKEGEHHPMWATMVSKVVLWMGHWRAERAAKRDAQKTSGKMERFTQPSHVALLCRAHTLFMGMTPGVAESLAKQPLDELRPSLTVAQHHTLQRALLLANTFNVLSQYPAETAFMSVLPDHLANALSADDVARAIVKRVTDAAAEEAKQEGEHEALLGVLQNVDPSVTPSISNVEEQLKSVQALDVAVRRKALKVLPLTLAYLRSVWGRTDGGKEYALAADAIDQKTDPLLFSDKSSEVKASQSEELTQPLMIAANMTILLRLAARGLSEISRLASSDDASLREAAGSLQVSAWPQAMIAALQLALLPAVALAVRAKAQKKALSDHQVRMAKYLALHAKMLTALKPLVQRSANAAEKKVVLAPWLTTKAKQFCDRLLNNCTNATTKEERAVLQKTADAVQQLGTIQLSPKETKLMRSDKTKILPVQRLQKVLLEMAYAEIQEAAQQKIVQSEWQSQNALSSRLLNELHAQLSALNDAQKGVADEALSQLAMASKMLSHAQREMQQHRALDDRAYVLDILELLKVLKGVPSNTKPLFSLATGSSLPQIESLSLVNA